MSGITLKDILERKKEGDDWYSFQLPEELHMWTLSNQWKNEAFKKYNIKPSKISIWGEFESNKTEMKYTQRGPLFLKCGVDIRSGKTVSTTKATASFGPINIDSAVEVNQILEELSQKTGIAIWVIKSMWLYTYDKRELNFRKHNPNGTGASLYFYRLTDADRNVLYPLVSLHEQQGLVDSMNITLAHCKLVVRQEKGPACGILKMKKKSKTSTKWIKLN